MRRTSSRWSRPTARPPHNPRVIGIPALIGDAGGDLHCARACGEGEASVFVESLESRTCFSAGADGVESLPPAEAASAVTAGAQAAASAAVSTPDPGLEA